MWVSFSQYIEDLKRTKDWEKAICFLYLSLTSIYLFLRSDILPSCSDVVWPFPIDFYGLQLLRFVWKLFYPLSYTSVCKAQIMGLCSFHNHMEINNNNIINLLKHIFKITFANYICIYLYFSYWLGFSEEPWYSGVVIVW